MLRVATPRRSFLKNFIYCIVDVVSVKSGHVLPSLPLPPWIRTSLNLTPSFLHFHPSSPPSCPSCREPSHVAHPSLLHSPNSEKRDLERCVCLRSSPIQSNCKAYSTRFHKLELIIFAFLFCSPNLHISQGSGITIGDQRLSPSQLYAKIQPVRGFLVGYPSSVVHGHISQRCGNRHGIIWQYTQLCDLFDFSRFFSFIGTNFMVG